MGGRGQPQQHLFQAFNCSSGLQMLAWLKLTGKELAFELSSYMVSLCPFCVHSRDQSAKAFPVFHCSSASMYYTEHEPKNYQWRRPGNEATNGKNNFLHDFLMPTRITFLYLVHELKQSCLVFFQQHVQVWTHTCHRTSCVQHTNFVGVL